MTNFIKKQLFRSFILFLGLIGNSLTVNAQTKIILIEDAIENAHFTSYHLSQGGYGYVVVTDCPDCEYTKEKRLSINPDTEFTVDGIVTHANQFNFYAEGFTMVFYKDDENLITRIKRSSN